MNRIVLVNQNMLIINQQQQNTYVYSSHDDVHSCKKKSQIRQLAHKDMKFKSLTLGLCVDLKKDILSLRKTKGI